jgi:hypothetical protein
VGLDVCFFFENLRGLLVEKSCWSFYSISDKNLTKFAMPTFHCLHSPWLHQWALVLLFLINPFKAIFQIKMSKLSIFLLKSIFFFDCVSSIEDLWYHFSLNDHCTVIISDCHAKALKRGCTISLDSTPALSEIWKETPCYFFVNCNFEFLFLNAKCLI